MTPGGLALGWISLGAGDRVARRRLREPRSWSAALAPGAFGGAGWVLAALGEELAYRGHLMNRVADLGEGI